ALVVVVDDPRQVGGVQGDGGKDRGGRGDETLDGGGRLPGAAEEAPVPEPLVGQVVVHHMRRAGGVQRHRGARGLGGAGIHRRRRAPGRRAVQVPDVLHTIV